MGYSIDWNKELNNPNVEWPKLSSLADDFTTCAVGNTSNRIKRNQGGAPLHKELNHLGYQFLEAIDNEDRPTAKNLLKKINTLAKSLETKKDQIEEPKLTLSVDFSGPFTI